MSDPATSSVKVARTDTGYVARVEGRGTYRDSEVLHERALCWLGDGQATLVVDLSACEYLDSTFLGCLVDLFKRFGSTSSERFVVAASDDRRKMLMGYTRLDTVIKMIDEPPTARSLFEELPVKDLNRDGLGHHIIHTHRRLAEMNGPQQKIFSCVAERMQRELGDETTS